MSVRGLVSVRITRRAAGCMRSQFSPLQVTGQINAASANFGSGQVIASDILSQGGLNITAHGDVFILPDDGKSLRVYSDMSMGGRDVLRVGDMIRLNGSGVVAVGSLEIDAELSRIRSVAGNITVASSDSVHFVKEGGGASNVLLVGESARLVLQGSEAFALVSKQEGALELQGVNPGSQLAETIWSTDHVFVQDFVVNGSTWLSDYTGTVSAHHLKSYSAVLGYISMTA